MKKAIAIIIGVLVAIPALMVLMTLYVSYVAFKLYTWFGVTAGLPELGYWHVYGLMLLVSFMTLKLLQRPKNKIMEP
jgi:hypothetical protein